MRRKTVCVSFGHLNSFDAGLGEFAFRLGSGLVEQVSEFHDNGLELAFHLAPHLHGRFGNSVGYLPYRRRQEYLRWHMPGCALWHNAFQHNITRPPVEARQRLLTVHDLNYRYLPQGPGAWRDRLRTWLAVARSNELICITQYVARDVESSFAASSRPISVIYNGATDLTTIAQTPVPELEGRKFMFHMSRMAPSKNVESLLALARIWPEQTFVFSGPEWGHALALRERVSGSMPNVRFLLAVSESTKAWLLANCQAFLFPSLTEGFGLPPIEAMHFGTPVFLSDRTCLPEIGADRVGYFGDFEPWAMRRLIEAELPRLEGSRQLTRQRAAMFTWDSCVDGYFDAYKRALA